MNNFIIFLLSGTLLISATSCVRSSPEQTIVSMQMVDRNGFSETISAKERLGVYQKVDFLKPQPYEKVLRVFGKNEEGKNISKLTNYHSNGGVWQYLEAVDGRAHGRYLEWHPNGQLKIAATIIEGQADLSETAAQTWLFDKECHIYDQEGRCIAHFFYSKGLLDKEATYYFSSGVLYKKIPYVQGAIQGTVQIYSQEGVLAEEISFHQGRKEGKAVGYWEFPHIKYEESYTSGFLMKARYLSKGGEELYTIENGEGIKAEFEKENVHTLLEYHKGSPEGEVRCFDKKGFLQTLYHIKEGKKTGEEWHYYPESSDPKMLISWDQDLIQGITKTWYPHKILESQREMTHNQKHGLSLAYYENSDLMLVEEYDNGLLIKGSYYKLGDKEPISIIEGGNGVATLHNSKGHLLSKITYEKSSPVIR